MVIDWKVDMKSLRLRFVLSFLMLIAVIYVMFYFGVQFFLEDYYYDRKVDSILLIEKNVETAISLNTSKDEQESAIEYINYNFEGKVSIFSASGKESLSDSDIAIMTRAMDVKKEIISEKEIYFIKTAYPVENTSWLVYSSLLKNGDILLVQSPIAGIVNSVNIMKKFINVVLLISVLIALVISLILANNLTRPINKLNKMASELRELHFNKVYEIDRADEIGMLSQSLVDLSDNLERTIKSLNFELSKDKEINNIRRKFIATASHELRTPLTVIKTYIEALDDGIVEDENERKLYYKIIADEVDKLTYMVRELLQITFLESDEFILDKKEFNIKEMLENLARDYGAIAYKKEIPFAFELMDEDIFYKGDENRLEQALRNVLNNAFKFSDKKEEVLLSANLYADTLKISIKNSGNKIADKDLAKVFDIFYKDEEKGGSGIGLAVTSNILDKHGVDYYMLNTQTGVRFTAKILLKK